MMTRKLFATIVFIIFPLLYGSAQTTTVSGKLSELEEGEDVYVFEMFGPQLVPVDTTKTNDGQFSFSRSNPFPRGFYRIGKNNQEGITLILSDESFSFSGEISTPLSINYSGSPENDLFLKFRTFNDKLSKLNQQFTEEVKTMQNEQGAEAASLKFQPKFDSLNRLRTNYYQGLIEENGDSFIGKISKSLVADVNSSESDYFRENELNDDELTRSDLLVGKVFKYYQKFVTRDLNSWVAAGDKLIALTEPASPQREIFYLSLINIFANGAPDQVYTILSQYGNDFPNSAHYQYLVAIIPPPPPQIGDVAPEIELPDQNGELQQLSNLRGNFVLVDFWASWCGPCRQENPNIVRTYHKFKDQGFQVLGISLDNKMKNWLSAIEKDQLTWQHVSDLKGWQSEGAAIYQVRSIPASFLIDPEGRIVAKNLRGSSLEQTLHSLYNKEKDK